MSIQAPNVHELYASGNLDRFRQFLASSRKSASSGPSNAANNGNTGGGGSWGSYSKSPGNAWSWGIGQASSAEVNRRDVRGRTVLHLVASSDRDDAIDWLQALLDCPNVNVNIQDGESGWTALHRAFYHGRLVAARALLKHIHVDPRIKDNEGLTPIDVWNSTIEGTNPKHDVDIGRTELYTWGTNRNFVLGLAGDGDRLNPEKIQLKRSAGEDAKGARSFDPAGVSCVAMARLHTAVVTDESKGNVRLCGFGSGGRLGVNVHTQFTLQTPPDFRGTAKDVAVAQDHTILVTNKGDVFTFGLNRFSQLGYVVEQTPGQTAIEPIQATPRRVYGLLKKEIVIGVAASKVHTVAFTEDSVYTWGTNYGQLGYPSATTPVQVLPRKVTLINQAVKQVAATEYATACLTESSEVLVLQHDNLVKVVFPIQRFPASIQVHHGSGRRTLANSGIARITSGGDTLLAVGELGDVFTWDVGETQDLSAKAPKPTRVWDLRKRFQAVTDAAIGQDGSIILSTVSGHVYVRNRRPDANAVKGVELRGSLAQQGGGRKLYKFARVPFLQRVIRVAANSTGAFAAIRADVPLQTIDVSGTPLGGNLLALLPYLRRQETEDSESQVGADDADASEAGSDVEDDRMIDRDVAAANKLLEIVAKWDEEWSEHSAGSDMVLVASGRRIPCHQAILAARSPVIHRILVEHKGTEGIKFSKGSDLQPVLTLDCIQFSCFLLLHYLYSDDLPAIWDSRVFHRLTVDSLPRNFPSAVKDDIQALAHRLQLPLLAHSLGLSTKRKPEPSLASQIGRLLETNSRHHDSPTQADVILRLAEHESIFCHSVILRARCPFFEMMYEDDEWTRERRTDGEPISINMEHLTLDVMSLVLDFIYTDKNEELLDNLDCESADEYIDYLVQIISVANELLLDRLKEVCSAVLVSFVNLNTVVSIMADASFYEATSLKHACMHYISCSMETVLERRLLDDVPLPLLDDLAAYCKGRQIERMPVSRSGKVLEDLLVKHEDFVAELDIPKPPSGLPRKIKSWNRPSPGGVSPADLSFNTRSPALRARDPASSSPSQKPFESPSNSPVLRPVHEGDEMFVMDEEMDSPHLAWSNPTSPLVEAVHHGSPGRGLGSSPLASPPSPLLLSRASFSRTAVWNKAAVETERIPPLDLRSIMAKEGSTESRNRRGLKGAPSPPLRAIDSPETGPSSTKLSQRERKHQASTTQPLVAPASSSGPSSMPWRPPTTPSWRAAEAAKVSLSTIQAQQSEKPSTPPSGRIATPPGGPAQSLLSRTMSGNAPNAPPALPHRATSGLSPSAGPSPVLQPADPASAIGSRVITPTRLASSRSRSSLSNADKAWANYFPTDSLHGSSPPAPEPTFATSTSPTAGLSFAAIQSQQRDEDDLLRVKRGPRSFAQIQEEENARKEEEEFLRWWEAESLRVKMEEEAGSSSGHEGASGGKRGGRGGRGGSRARGRGRGGKPSSGSGPSSENVPPPPPSGPSPSRRGAPKTATKGRRGGLGSRAAEGDHAAQNQAVSPETPVR